MIRALMFGCLSLAMLMTTSRAETFQVIEDDEQITIVTPQLEASIRKTGYVSGVAGGSFVDRKTGAKDLGFGLDIVDWIMEPGSDQEYRNEIDGELVYRYNNLYHGQQPKRSIEGPQICTKALSLSPEDHSRQGLRCGANVLHLQDCCAGKAGGFEVDADHRVPRRQAVLCFQ